MLKFMTDHRGMMSIFTLFVLVPVMVIAAVLIDFARLSAIKASASATAETYANSYLSIYDELLNEMYGILAISQDSEEGKKLKEDLENYMKAAYAPNKVEDTHITGTYAHLLVQEILGSENKNALYLTGSALGELGAEEYAMLSDSNYDILQMQVSEYVKFIGPTELVINVGDFASKLTNSSESESEVEQTKKNQELIKRKNDIDEKMGELNQSIGNLFAKVKQYDEDYNKLYDDMQMYLIMEITTYYSAINSVNSAMEELKPIAKEIKGAARSSDDGNNITTVINKNKQKVQDIITDGNKINKNGSSFEVTVGDIGKFFDYNLQGASGGTVAFSDNYGLKEKYFNTYKADSMLNFDDYISDWVNQEFAPRRQALMQLRSELVSSCTDIGAVIAQLSEDIDSLVNDARSNGEEDLAKGLESDYSFFTGKGSSSEGQSQTDAEQYKALQDLKDYDFTKFGQWFDEYGNRCENQLWDDFYDNGLVRLTSRDGMDLDMYLMKMYSVISEMSVIVLGTDDPVSEYDSIQYKIAGFLNNEFDQLIDPNDTNYDPYIVSSSPYNEDGVTFPLAYYHYSSDPDYQLACYVMGMQPGNVIGLTPMNKYYEPLKNANKIPDYSFGSMYSGKSWNDVVCGDITWKRIYQILSEWHADGKSESDEQNQKKEAAEDLAKLLKNISLPGENIKLRGGKKRISVGSSGGDDYSGKPNFDDIVTDSNSIPTPESGVDIAMNKLMLMMYDYGMFTCQTSDMEEDPDNSSKINRIQPMSYQGVALAEESDGKYESSDTDFLLYNEMEYIFGGNADSEKNFNKVRNCLAAIRFVPNYISTYSIKEINSMIDAVRAALSWCPLAAVVVCQALRIGFAALETWADLDLLYGGHSVLFTKSKIEDLSLIAAVKAAAAKADASDDMKGLMGNIKDVTGTDLSSVNTSKKSGGLKVNYKQYLLLLELVFVNQYDMIKRTGDLIETNINYVNGSADISSDGDVQVLTLNDSSWRLSKAATAVKTSVDVNLDFIFIGNGSDSVFNTSDYENVSELADKDSVYTMTVKRKY